MKNEWERQKGIQNATTPIRGPADFFTTITIGAGTANAIANIPCSIFERFQAGHEQSEDGTDRHFTHIAYCPFSPAFTPLTIDDYYPVAEGPVPPTNIVQVPTGGQQYRVVFIGSIFLNNGESLIRLYLQRLLLTEISPPI